LNIGLMAASAFFLAAFAATVAAGWFKEPNADVVDLTQQKADKNAETRVYYGVGSCRSCHLRGFEDPDTFICRGTEVAIWQPEDKHALAFKVLGDERAQRMGKILGWDVKKKKECLVCHSVWVDEKPELVSKAGNFSHEEGVSCVACHGPDVVVLPGKDKTPKLGWLDMHGSQNQQFREAWRKLARTYKHDEYGMSDMWDPVKRTQLCASCHIGNVEQGKVVTHEMYAAGHPPLPSFEVATFSNQMPRHWQYLGEKDKKVRDQLKFRPTEVELEETHLLALGGLVGFREYLQMLSSHTQSKNWPEFADFSCYACHHDLKSKSWRQERGYFGKPGRPPLKEGTTALVELGLFHAAANADEAQKLIADFQARYAALQEAVDSQPFGQPAAVKQESDKLIGWIDTQVKRIQDRIALGEKKGGYSADASGNLLGHLLKSRSKFLDYDSARQQTWALQTLYLDTASRHDMATRKKLADTMKTQTAWKDLDDYLRLTLPPGQTKIETSLPLSMERAGQYEPRQYFQNLDAVLKQLKTP